MISFGVASHSKSYRTVTNHAKSIRSLVGDPSTRTFVSAGEDALKRWKGKDAEFTGNFSRHHEGIVNTLSRNEDGVVREEQKKKKTTLQYN